MSKSAKKRLEDCQRIITNLEERLESSLAVIEYAIEDDEGIMFLKLWNEGDFKALREEWDNIPDEVFIGADPMFRPVVKDEGGYFQYCSFDEPNWTSCSEKEYRMYEDLPTFETRINPARCNSLGSKK